MNKKNTRKGFTIVELVIVIAVIAILATVMIPTFGNMIKKANASKDLQAAKNAYTLYLADFDYTTGTPEETVYYVGVNCDVVIEKGEASILGESDTIPADAVLINADGSLANEPAEEPEDEPAVEPEG